MTHFQQPQIPASPLVKRETDEELGARLRAWREACGWKPVDLASRLGVSDRTLRYWEKGEHHRLPAKYSVPLRALGFEIEQHGPGSGIRSQQQVVREAALVYEGEQAFRVFESSFLAVAPDAYVIWIINPARHALNESPTIEEQWASNLALGARYRVLWDLDEIERTDLTRFFRSVEEILKRVAELAAATGGRIEFHAVRTKAEPPALEAYSRLMEESELPSFRIRPPVDRGEIGEIERVLKGPGREDAMIVYTAPDGLSHMNMAVVESDAPGSQGKGRTRLFLLRPWDSADATAEILDRDSSIQ